MTHILCHECGSLEICVECFANGMESSTHLKTHNYQIIQKMDFPILEEGWSSFQELKFLEAMEVHGFGNWEEIAIKMGDSKTAIDVERHFYDCYLNYLNDEIDKEQMEKRQQKIQEQKQSDMEIEFQPLIDRKIDQLQNVIEQAKDYRETMNPDKKTIFGDILGYMPLRGDFDMEYENEAEILLSEMNFNEEDTNEEKKIKYSILEIYNRRLQERQKRKTFLIERNKLDLEATFKKEKEMSKMEREIRNPLKKYERFLSQEQHEELVNCIKKELEYKEIIEQLVAIKMSGSKTLKEFEELVFNPQEQKKKVFNLSNLNSFKEKTTKRKTAYKLTNEETFKQQLGQKESYILSEEELKSINQKEMKLCQELNIGPDDFFQIKECLIQEAIENYFINREDFKKKYDYRHSNEIFNRIFDFFKAEDIILEDLEQVNQLL